MYAIKRPRLILALALVNVAAALLATVIGALTPQQSGPMPHELCRAPIRYAVMSAAHSAIAATAPATVRTARCAVGAPLAMPTPGFELLDNRDCR
jgi:hypothetical protein